MTLLQSIVLGLLQGLTELFPVSSLGHSILVPAILHWQINESSDFFLTFLVATHFATALVLLYFFRKDWLAIVKGFLHSVKNKKVNTADTYEKLAWLIIIGTVPAGILGFLFDKKLQALFSSAGVIALFLIANGAMLFLAEWLRKKSAAATQMDTDARVASLSWADAVKVGFAQCLALLPGFSRTGATLSAGLSRGLDHSAAARFAFLLATPIIFAAALLKLPLLLHLHAGRSLILIGALAAAVAAYVSLTFLEKYFKTKTLTPFAVYCIIAGCICLFLL